MIGEEACILCKDLFGREYAYSKCTFDYSIVRSGVDSCQKILSCVSSCRNLVLMPSRAEIDALQVQLDASQAAVKIVLAELDLIAEAIQKTNDKEEKARLWKKFREVDKTMDELSSHERLLSAQYLKTLDAQLIGRLCTPLDMLTHQSKMCVATFGRSRV